MLTMRPFTYLLAAAAGLGSLASAEKMLSSTSLNPCMSDSKFSAKLFNVTFLPDQKILAIDIHGVSAISGNVTAQFKVFAYGIQAYSQVINGCDPQAAKDYGLGGFCPMNVGQITLTADIALTEDVIKKIPGIAYTIPDLDANVQIFINDTDTSAELACVEAVLTNGKTVYQKAVGWVTAIIAGIGLIASAITSGLGHSNTAAHVAANALSLFGFFQAQAIVGMCAVPLPPIAAAWTQNFQWSMGIIRVGFLQEMATWYQRATGGTPSTVLQTLDQFSVAVQKRSVDVAKSAYNALVPRLLAARAKTTDDPKDTSKTVILKGIERVGFRANIELTNIFFTGYVFFIIFVFFVVFFVILFKYVLEAFVRTGKLKSDKFSDFRNGWKTVLKGILFRIILIGFPQMVLLCFWELTVRDSAAEVLLAISTIVTMVALLGWASFKVWRIAQRSISMHKNPAYILYSDPVALNKWGFLYVQFKATSYYFIVPLLVYILIKGMFIGLAQSSGVTQAVALVLIEAALLITLAVIRPYMDKKTNGLNIAISAINFLGAIFVLVFSEVFNQPGIVTAVFGVAYFFINAVFSLILLIMVLVASVYALASKNPDTRYQPMRDDRGSFIKSQTQLNVGAELDALGATARGDKSGAHAWSTSKSRSAIDDDDSSFESEIPHNMSQPNLQAGANGRYRDSTYSTYSHQSQTPSGTLMPAAGYQSPAPSSRNGARGGGGASPWQRGAGYD